MPVHARRASDTIALMCLDYGKCFGFTEVWFRLLLQSSASLFSDCQTSLLPAAVGGKHSRPSVPQVGGFPSSCLPAVLILGINGPADVCWSMRLFRRPAVPLRAALLARLLTC